MGNTQPTPPSPIGELRATGTLDIKDSRTDKNYSVQILQGGVEGDTATRAMDLRQIKTSPDEFGLMTYDPAFMNTASCKSAITFIDGDKGILRYRGYPIEQLAEKATFLEVAWLLRHGELPDAERVRSVGARHHVPHVRAREHQDVPAGIPLRRASDVDALLARSPRCRRSIRKRKNIHDPKQRNISIVRLLAKLPTLAAFCYRHVKGLPFIYPDNDLSYVENFLSMVARMSEPKYEANPVFVKALEILFILHADHEQNCSTNAVRAVGSSHVDPFSAIAAGIAALYGPLHGGANEQVLRMINEIGHPKNVPAFIDEVKGGKGSRLMGFGHRVYKSYDPRAKIVKKLADEVFKQVGMDKDLEIALKLEEVALSRRLLRVAQALPERRLLHRADLPLDGVPDRLLHRAVRRGAHGRLAGAVGRDAQRQGAEDRASAADLRRLRRAAVRQPADRIASRAPRRTRSGSR